MEVYGALSGYWNYSSQKGVGPDSQEATQPYHFGGQALIRNMEIASSLLICNFQEISTGAVEWGSCESTLRPKMTQVPISKTVM